MLEYKQGGDRMNEKEMLNDCIALTQNFISQYYQRKIDFCLSCLDKDFVFIGPYNFQQSHGKNEFMKIAEQQRKEDKNKVKINISHKHYSLIERNAYLWIIECSYYAHTTMKDGRYLLTKPRCTFIWKRKKNAWILLHLHISYARDIPLVFDNTFKNNTIQNYSSWFQYINEIDTLENRDRRTAYSDINGHIHYLFPSEIIYVKVDDKLCTIHTFGDPIIVRNSLSQILEQSPFLTKVHKQYLVNNRYVKAIKRYQLTLIHDITIPVSQKNYLQIKQDLNIIK